jgi:hypothetical protein
MSDSKGGKKLISFWNFQENIELISIMASLSQINGLLLNLADTIRMMNEKLDRLEATVVVMNEKIDELTEDVEEITVHLINEECECEENCGEDCECDCHDSDGEDEDEGNRND